MMTTSVANSDGKLDLDTFNDPEAKNATAMPSTTRNSKRKEPRHEHPQRISGRRPGLGLRRSLVHAAVRKWLAAIGKTEEDINSKDPVPYVVSFVMAILVAGMMRHMFVTAGIDGMGKGLITGLGLGLFVAAPWLVNNVLYAGRDRSLIWIDGGYIVGGCTVIGLVLGLLL